MYGQHKVVSYLSILVERGGISPTLWVKFCEIWEDTSPRKKMSGQREGLRRPFNALFDGRRQSNGLLGVGDQVPQSRPVQGKACILAPPKKARL